MEVVFFTESYPPMRDGVAQVTGGLARQLVRLGHRVRVFAPHPRGGMATMETEEDGVRVARLRSITVPLYSQYRWPLFPLGALRVPRGAADADIVHVHSPGPLGSVGFLASRRFARPLVGTFHTNIKAMSGSFPSKFLVPEFFRIAWWWNLGLYWRCDVATAPSISAREDLEGSVRKPFRRSVEVVRNGIDLDRFLPHLPSPDWRTRCGLSSAPLVTYLGRLTIDKGVHRFLDAVAEAARETDLVAVVGGVGPEEESVRHRIRSDPLLQGRVRYVGPVTEEEKPALLGQSDLFVLPSTSDTSSVALLEAMACGAAVVAPAEGGASELVVDGVTGRCVPMLSSGALGRTIVDLVREPSERHRLATRGHEYVRTEGSLETMARRFISIYEHLIDVRESDGRRTSA